MTFASADEAIAAITRLGDELTNRLGPPEMVGGHP
jgi:hypothetical protein